MKKWEDYLNENGVLKNKLGITDPEVLYKKETEMVLEKLTNLIYNDFLGNFDTSHLQAIHKYLFEELYDFAGSFREVEMFKPKSDTKFSQPDLIKESLDNLTTYANNFNIEGKTKFEIAQFLGDYYYKLIMIHPFREGNGRAIREFLREFVSYKLPGYELNYSKIDKKNFLLGIVEHDTYPSLLAFEIYNALEALAKNK